jgi:hypothetical protein
METILQSLEREGHTDPLDNEVYCILKKLEIRSKSIPDVVPINPSPNSPKGATCENCGLPSDSVASDGYVFSLETRPDNKFQHRSTKHRVWGCSGECVIQSLARNKYGEASHKWPVTLAEFRQIEGSPFLRSLERLDRDEIPSQSVENKDQKMGLFENVTTDALEGFRNAPRRSGRRKQHSSAAARQRAYRDRQREAA